MRSMGEIPLELMMDTSIRYIDELMTKVEDLDRLDLFKGIDVALGLNLAIIYRLALAYSDYDIMAEKTRNEMEEIFRNLYKVFQTLSPYIPDIFLTKKSIEKERTNVETPNLV